MAGAVVLAIGLCSGHPSQAFVGDMPTPARGSTAFGTPGKYAERPGGRRVPIGLSKARVPSPSLAVWLMVGAPSPRSRYVPCRSAYSMPNMPPCRRPQRQSIRFSAAPFRKLWLRSLSGTLSSDLALCTVAPPSYRSAIA
jgi:hypothetical protein